MSCCIYQVNSQKFVSLADLLCFAISLLFSLCFYLLMGAWKERKREFVLVRAGLCDSLKLFQENKKRDHLVHKHTEIRQWQAMHILRI